MRVATWNVYCGALSAKRLQALEETLLSLPADVLALQEVTAQAWLAFDRLKRAFPHHALVPDCMSETFAAPPFFVALLSRWPLAHVKYTEFPNSPQERGLLSAVVLPNVDVPPAEDDAGVGIASSAGPRRRRRPRAGVPFVIGTTHLESPLGVRGTNADRRDAQLRQCIGALAGALESSKLGTALLVGDLNWLPHLHVPLDDVLSDLSLSVTAASPIALSSHTPLCPSGQGRRTRRRISADASDVAPPPASPAPAREADAVASGTQVTWRDGWCLLGRGESGGATYDSARNATCGEKSGLSRLDRVVVGQRASASRPARDATTPTTRLAARLTRSTLEGGGTPATPGAEDAATCDYLLVGAWLFGAPPVSKVGFYSPWSLPPPASLAWLYDTTGDCAPPWAEKEEGEGPAPSPDSVAAAAPPAATTPAPAPPPASAGGGDGDDHPTSPCTPTTPTVIVATDQAQARRRAFTPSDHYGLLVHLDELAFV